MKSRFSAERIIEAPADVVYHCIADYREHHRPEGFLPEAFSDLQVERGGMGAGTELRWVVEVGGRRRTVHAAVASPRRQTAARFLPWASSDRASQQGYPASI